MSTYVIGDIQGCFNALKRLLSTIQFHPSHDKLWLVGDLVNRGPKSADVLRMVRDLGDNAIVTLGNHDLTLLAMAYDVVTPKKGDTFDDVLEAFDGSELITWLQSRALIHYDPQLNCVMAHAGLYPLWTIEKAASLAREVEDCLQSEVAGEYLKNMFGEEPKLWKDDLEGWDRLRFITNALTRMRYLSLAGELNLNKKGPPTDLPEAHLPWYAWPNPFWEGVNVVFGHWASLEGQCPIPHVYALDTGCVWGKSLSAFCLETRKHFSVACDSLK